MTPAPALQSDAAPLDRQRESLVITAEFVEEFLATRGWTKTEGKGHFCWLDPKHPPHTGVFHHAWHEALRIEVDRDEEAAMRQLVQASSPTDPITPEASA